MNKGKEWEDTIFLVKPAYGVKVLGITQPRGEWCLGSNKTPRSTHSAFDVTMGICALCGRELLTKKSGAMPRHKHGL